MEVVFHFDRMKHFCPTKLYTYYNLRCFLGFKTYCTTGKDKGWYITFLQVIWSWLGGATVLSDVFILTCGCGKRWIFVDINVFPYCCSYVGRLFVKSSGKPSEILTKLNEMAGYDPDEKILLSEVCVSSLFNIFQLLSAMNFFRNSSLYASWLSITLTFKRRIFFLHV